MLSRKYIEKVRQAEAQCPGESCFSPWFHMYEARDQMRHDTGAVLNGNSDRKVTIQLGHMLHPSGDVTIAHRDTPLPEGAKWIEK